MRQLLSLRQWALAIIILPTIIISLLIGGFITYKRYVELDQNIIERGIYLSEPLTLFASNAMEQDRPELLAKALESAHLKASPFVRSISIFSPDHQLYLSSNIHIDFANAKLKPGKLLPDRTSIEHTDDFIYVRSPVHKVHLNTAANKIEEEELLYGYLVVELSREHAKLAQQTSILSVVAIFAVAIFLMVFLAVVFVKYIFNPIDDITQVIKDIAKGDTKARVSQVMQGELESLRNAVNAVAKAVYIVNEKAEHNISEHTQELQQTVEQLEVQNIELNMAKREAQNANEVKSQFLANMSHELRTPLNGVLGFTRQLRKTQLNPNQVDFLDTIESSANNLLRIINDILDFSKLDAGKMELETISFSLRDTVNEVMTLLAPGVFDKGLEVHLRVDSRVPDELLGDPVRLKQVIINLVGNAIKFTQNGYVRLDIVYLGSRQEGHHIQFNITDSGIGIDQAGQEKLFAAFGQADNSTTRKYGGTGLGLIICKKLIEAMSGDIQFTTELGKGSVFTFDATIKESSNVSATEIPVQLLEDKKVLYFDTNSQAFADVQELFADSTDVKLTAVDCEDEFKQVLEVQSFDMVIIGRKVAPSSIGELKKLVVMASQYCNRVYTLINSISPNLKEAIIGSGAQSCFSMPINHRKLLNTLVQPYLEPIAQVQETGSNFNGMRVLAVDDTDANLKLLSALLDELSIEVELAHNGSEALEKAQKVTYDLIFMDIQMPIMDGITACREIKASSLNEDTPIISVTAHAGPDEQQRMDEVGFSGFLPKPIYEDMLTQVILDACPGCALVAKQNSQLEPEVELPDFAASEHIDWPLALSRAAGKQELAVEMFSMLIKSLPDALASIELAAQQNNVESLIAAVHKFHGACCYTGVPKLKQLAEIIETGLKKDKVVDVIEPELLELIDQMSALIVEANKWSISKA